MICNIRHRGLRVYYQRGVTRYLNPNHIPKIQRILTALAVASEPVDMDLPGFGLHRLKGEYLDYYAVSVSGNWRIIFRFEIDDVTDVELVDYH